MMDAKASLKSYRVHITTYDICFSPTPPLKISLIQDPHPADNNTLGTPKKFIQHVDQSHDAKFKNRIYSINYKTTHRKKFTIKNKVTLWL